MALPAPDGAIDVDLPITPFTNTLPIRRLDLADGQSADLRVAYISMPEFQVIADPQRGLVIVDPGLFGASDRNPSRHPWFELRSCPRNPVSAACVP